ncbi:hypothetical protein [Benzoatithermus flavus]|uniref:CMP/dCMP-type deaminase domain-containing protein n=1 Tax=Benzoatithermus flavus TaxID=3108223 RepID=A0ABU8XT03_9PROT
MAVDLAVANVRDHGGRPFGAVVVRDGRIIAIGVNGTRPTRRRTRLDGCVIHASGCPARCASPPMYLAGVSEAWFVCASEDAERFGPPAAAVCAGLAKPLAE